MKNHAFEVVEPAISTGYAAGWEVLVCRSGTEEAEEADVLEGLKAALEGGGRYVVVCLDTGLFPWLQLTMRGQCADQRDGGLAGLAVQDGVTEHAAMHNYPCAVLFPECDKGKRADFASTNFIA